jgi:hypothetical protein
VRERIGDALKRLQVRQLVCSAACGADQAGLEAAGALGIPRLVILPFDERRFRETSVIDRGGELGPPFDRTMSELRSLDAVRTLDGDFADNQAAYTAANEVILDEADAVGRAAKAAVVAILVAEGDDVYEGVNDSFAEAAKRRGLPIIVISTRA